MGRKDMVAVDGSEQAHHAFDWYLANMHREGDEVIVIHCAEYYVNIGLPGALQDINAICQEVKKKQDLVANLTDEFMNKLREKHIPAKLVQPQGEKPGEMIVKAAKDQGAETITMGTRGLGTLRRTLLGSVSEYVLHHANCPVTIVRHPKDEA